jgi:hypothetical protein
MSDQPTNLTFRNFLGAILGCVGGVVFAWHIEPHFVSMPALTFTGVIAGWWYDRVLNHAADVYRNVQATAEQRQKIFTDVSKRSSDLLGRIMGISEAGLSWVKWLTKAISTGALKIVSVPSYIGGLLRSFWQWLSASRENKAKLTIGATVIGLLVAVPVVLGFYSGSGQEIGAEKPVIAVWAFLALGSGFIGLVIANEGDLYQTPPSVFNTFGYSGLALYIVGRHILHTLGMVLYLSIVMPWTLGIMAAGFMGMYIAVPALAFMQRFYELARRRGHWLCLGVTFTAAAASWFWFGESFADPRIRWAVAFVSGFASGALTELIRRVSLVFFANTKFGRTLMRRSTMDVTLGDLSSGRPHAFNGTYAGLVVGIGGLLVRRNTVGNFLRAVFIGIPAGKYRQFV